MQVVQLVRLAILIKHDGPMYVLGSLLYVLLGGNSSKMKHEA